MRGLAVEVLLATALLAKEFPRKSVDQVETCDDDWMDCIYATDTGLTTHVCYGVQAAEVVAFLLITHDGVVNLVGKKYTQTPAHELVSFLRAEHGAIDLVHDNHLSADGKKFVKRQKIPLADRYAASPELVYDEDKASADVTKILGQLQEYEHRRSK